jgi:hypothetical protein
MCLSQTFIIRTKPRKKQKKAKKINDLIVQAGYITFQITRSGSYPLTRNLGRVKVSNTKVTI